MGSFDAGSSCGLNAGHLSQNGWLIVDIMHLNWRQSTQIGTQVKELNFLLWRISAAERG
jgi:hypothetical protein